MRRCATHASVTMMMSSKYARSRRRGKATKVRARHAHTHTHTLTHALTHAADTAPCLHAHTRTQTDADADACTHVRDAVAMHTPAHAQHMPCLHREDGDGGGTRAVRRAA